ncbi:MAG: hypothetical protein H7144_05820 [Burkholderiales bacterium]|nr:hypothetical protein [Phycisphaerae bacterium]
MASTSRPSTTAMQVHLSKSMAILIGCLVVAPWSVVIWILLHKPHVVAVSAPAQHTAAPTTAVTTSPGVAVTQPDAVNIVGSRATTQASLEVTASRPGPWGRLEHVPIVLELPDEYVFVPPENFPPVKWTFPDFSRAQAMAFLTEAGLTRPQLEQLEKAKWSTVANGSVVEPGDPLILAISTEARKNIYSRLMQFKDNQRVIDPYWYRPGIVDHRLRGSELSEASVQLLKKLLYPGGRNLLLFADIEPAVRSISDPAERQKFMKTISRKRSLIARAIITKETDINAMAEYWGVDGRQKDLVPLLSALRYNNVAGFVETPKVNLLLLLPPFARDRLYNHPFSKEQSSGEKEDCFWSAFNFFNPDPDYRLNDLAYAAQVLQKDYYKIAQPGRLGDLILLADAGGNAVHAASFIADDIVFTKNGENYTQPWILMRMEDMLDTYRIKTQDLQVLCYRKKNI